MAAAAGLEALAHNAKPHQAASMKYKDGWRVHDAKRSKYAGVTPVRRDQKLLYLLGVGTLFIVVLIITIYSWLLRRSGYY